MKRLAIGLLLVLGLSTGSWAKELDTKDGATISIKTQTAFGVDIDNPYKFGLSTTIPELLLSFNLAPWQKVGNKVKSNDPAGFIEVSVDGLSIRFANSGLKDYNNPGQNMGFGFNDSAKAPTGYFSPLYLANMRSGIAWGDFILQLAAQGGDNFWNPWHRTTDSSYENISSSWAAYDTRIQYQREIIPWMLTTTDTEKYYWDWDKQTQMGEDLATLFSGSMIGLQYNGTPFSIMAKVATQYNWTSSLITPSTPNGVATGVDFAYRPPEIKGLRLMGTLAGGMNYSGTLAKNLVTNGLKVGYEVPVAGMRGVSIEPYAAYDVALPLNGTATQHPALEVASGLTVHWSGSAGWSYDYLQGPIGRTGNTYSGLSVAYKLFDRDLTAAVPLRHGMLITLFEDSGDEGLLKGVGAEFAAQLYDLTNVRGANRYLLSSYLDYTFANLGPGQLVPWTKAFYDNVDNAGSRAQHLKIDAGIKLLKVIRNVEFGLSYESLDLIGDPATDPSDASVKLSDYKGYGTAKLYINVSL